MAKCPKCQAELDENVKVCPQCGGNIGAKIDVSVQDKTSEFDATDIQNNKVMGVLAYLSWLVLVPIFGAKDSKFAKFHANQGLVLAICEIAWALVFGILAGIFAPNAYEQVAIALGQFSIKGLLSGLFGIICGVGELAFLACAVMGIVAAAQGQAKTIPFFGKFKILK